MSALLLTSPFLLAAGALGLEAGLRRRDRHRFPPPGRRVDVGGHALHARILGSGDPVVVLEADTGAWSSSWDRLPERLSEQTTVIAYDRAGLGWSGPGPGPRSPETLAREVRALLRSEVPDRPVVFVAHGAGARVARTFAARYPFELAGLVLVDGEHESVFVELEGAGVPSPAAGPRTLLALDWAGRLGFLRWTGYSPLGALDDDLPLPASTSATLRTLAPRTLAAVRAEERAAHESSGPDASLELPLRALVATESLSAVVTPPGYPRADFNRLWAQASARLARLSSQGEVVEVEGDHFFPIRRPQVVEEAVRAVLAAARA